MKGVSEIRFSVVCMSCLDGMPFDCWFCFSLFCVLQLSLHYHYTLLCILHWTRHQSGESAELSLHRS